VTDFFPGKTLEKRLSLQLDKTSIATSIGLPAIYLIHNFQLRHDKTRLQLPGLGAASNFKIKMNCWI
jgi:hypothetical protein